MNLSKCYLCYVTLMNICYRMQYDFSALLFSLQSAIHSEFQPMPALFQGEDNSRQQPLGELSISSGI